MATAPAITALFLDIGGVLATNGWDRSMRRQTAELFRLDEAEMNERHHLTFDTYEQGKLSLDEYLERTVFYQQRSFTREQFKAAMFSQSQPYPEMIDLVRKLKARHGLKTAVISNEGRELTEQRIRKFELKQFVDFFVVSCFVHARKPDKDIYRIALDIAQAVPEQSAYLEDRPMFVEVAAELGIRGIRHVDYASTRAALAEFGLTLEE